MASTNSIQYIFQIIDRYSPILQKLQRQNKSFENSVKKASARLKTLQMRLKRFGDTAGRVGRKLVTRLTLPLTILGGFLIKAASDAEEIASKFATVFDEVPIKAKKVAEDLRKNYGLSRVESKKLLSDTGDLLVGFGFTSDSALDLSEKVNKLAVDMASFQNLPSARTSQTITKALLGERESLKLLGVAILEEDIKRKVQILRAQGLTFATLRQAKAYATLILTQEQSKKAMGDWARTQHQFANRLKILKSRINDIAVGFGGLLVPSALKVVDKFIELANRIDKLDPGLKKLILLVGGLALVFGPLLVLIKGIIMGLAFFSGPLLLTTGLILALSAAAIIVANNWEIFKKVIEDNAAFQFISDLMAQIHLGIESVINSYAKLVNIIKRSPLSESFKMVKDLFKGTVSAVTTNNSSLDVQVGLNAPKGIINQVKTTQKGKNFKLGTNMRES